MVTVLALDGAMRNTGWQFLEVDCSPVAVDDVRAVETHSRMRRVEGGTLRTQTKKDPHWDVAIWKMVAQVEALKNRVRPDLIVVEEALSNSSTQKSAMSGYAMGVLLLGLQRAMFSKTAPKKTVVLAPSRYMSLVFGKTRVKPAEIRGHYEKCSGNLAAKVTEHEADAYFLGYLGVRFALVQDGAWSREILTPPERRAFFDGPNAIVKSRDVLWWGRSLLDS